MKELVELKSWFSSNCESGHEWLSSTTIEIIEPINSVGVVCFGGIGKLFDKDVGVVAFQELCRVSRDIFLSEQGQIGIEALSSVNVTFSKQETVQGVLLSTYYSSRTELAELLESNIGRKDGLAANFVSLSSCESWTAL